MYHSKIQVLSPIIRGRLSPPPILSLKRSCSRNLWLTGNCFSAHKLERHSSSRSAIKQNRKVDLEFTFNRSVLFYLKLKSSFVEQKYYGLLHDYKIINSNELNDGQIHRHKARQKCRRSLILKLVNDDRKDLRNVIELAKLFDVGRG